MWTNLLVLFLLAAGALLALVGLLDWRWSDREKEAMAHRAYRAQLWLADRRKVDPLFYLRNDQLQDQLLVVMALLTAVLAYSRMPESDLSRAGMAVVICTVGYFLALLHFGFLFKLRLYWAKTTREGILRILVGLLISMPILGVGWAIYTLGSSFWPVALIGVAIAGAATITILLAVAVLVLAFLTAPAIWVVHLAYKASRLALSRLLELNRGLLAATVAGLWVVAVGLLLKRSL